MFLYQTKTPDRIISVTHGFRAGRRTDSVLDHIKKGGLPVNPTLLSGIKKKISAGVYKEDRTSLINEVKKDPSLFVLTTKNLHRFTEPQAGGIVPERELQTISDDKLKSLFNVSDSDVSVHSVRKMSAAQALRLQHTVIGANCAEVVASKSEIVQDKAYTAATLRQLGLNMIAWNYPTQYAQVMRAKKKNNLDIEQELERILGVSPSEIAERLLSEWGIESEIKELAVSKKRNIDISKVESDEKNSLSLSEVCELAELFACANDEEHYPEAKNVWEVKKEHLSEKIGTDFVGEIEGKVSVSLSGYETVTSQKVFPKLVKSSKYSGVSSNRGESLFLLNAYAQKSVAEIQEQIHAVYALLEEDPKASIGALKKLVEEIVPQIGFQRGCLYVLDEKNLLLKPALRIGDKQLSAYGAFKLHQNNLITASIDSLIPVLQQGRSVDGGIRTQLCGALGASKPQGVLYLELKSEFFESSQHDPLLYFHVARVSLIDCLGLVRERARG
jgi:HDOD domain